MVLEIALEENKLKVFDELLNPLEVGKEIENFQIGENQLFSHLKGFPIFLVFWKTL
ncbi:MAG: hypothetical protein KG012_18335 [Deltaproteobacteria bacterium]|jgi:hypothetical protein|nr:hypothetical protein [Deltaproteobacteria bacterium]